MSETKRAASAPASKPKAAPVAAAKPTAEVAVVHERPLWRARDIAIVGLAILASILVAKFAAPLLIPVVVGTATWVITLSYLRPLPSRSEPLPFAVRYEELKPGAGRTIDGVRVLPFAVPHVQELQAFAYRIEVGGKTILYSGDSAWTEEFVAQSRGADLFLCECTTYETRLDVHISYPEIAARARDLHCRRLVLSHLGSEPLARLNELTLECARDGLTIDL